jgi:hypothetical protein
VHVVLDLVIQGSINGDGWQRKNESNAGFVLLKNGDKYS